MPSNTTLTPNSDGPAAPAFVTRSGLHLFAKEHGVSLETVCKGNRILLLGKLGDDCGKAEVRIDGIRAEPE